MDLKPKINEILKKRNSKVPVLQIMCEDSNDIEQKLQNILTFAETELEEGSKDFKDSILQAASQLQGIDEQVRELKFLINNLIKRFKRDTINIGVAGKARQGKSTLLQQISGLNDAEIPSSDELPCTGAKSKIFYHDGQPHARIDFYSDSEFLKEIIYSYYDTLELPKPSGIDSFSKDNIPAPNEKSKIYDTDRNLYNATYEKLKLIHSAIPSIKEYFFKISDMLEMKHIPDYVTQKNTKYLSVKVANIFTKFPHHDVSGLCLVDLPGLEASQGHEKKLAESLEHEVDAIIFVKIPSAQGTQYDKDDYKVIDLIDKSARDINLDDWLFIVLNVLNDKSNQKQAELLKQNPPQSSVKFNILIGNCKDSIEAQEKVFMPVLLHLEQNLEKIDKKYVKTIQDKINNISNRISEALKISNEKLKPLQEDRQMTREYVKLETNFIEDMKKKISSLLFEIYQNVKNAGSEFKTKIEEICEIAKNNPLVPESSNLEESYKEEGGWPGALQEKLHHLRADLSRFLADNIDIYLKEQVNKALVKVLNGIFKETINSLIPQSLDNPSETIRQLRDLFDEEMPNLKDAFTYLSKFDFSYHSHFHHRIRERMYLLDTFNQDFEDKLLPKDRGKKEIQEVAQEIQRGLQSHYLETIYEINKKLSDEMYSDPAYAVFSLVEEIGDRLVRKEDIEFEWKDFIYNFRGRLWPEIFGKFEKYKELYKNWEKTSDALIKSIQKLKDSFSKFN
ncbi:MAG: dynamin family protein [Desulfobacterales bacterium]|nr:dynamin family protein [Desulfobacterales bacterium]